MNEGNNEGSRNSKDFPEVNEFLLATVDRVVGTSVFVRLDDYGRDGVIIFSEISPGRIRNIRDYVKPGQKIVCKVLRVDKERGHVDLSLRRVSGKEKKEVLDAHKRDKEVRVMFGLVLKDGGRVKKIIDSVKKIIDLASLAAVTLGKAEDAIKILKEGGFSDQESEAFVKLLKEKIRKKKVSVKATISLSSEAPDGIGRIKDLLSNFEERKEKEAEVKISYLGAPNYLITIEGKDYKEANKHLKDILEEIEDTSKEKEIKFNVVKEK